MVLSFQKGVTSLKIGRDLVEDDVREGRAIGIVDQQRHIVAMRQPVKTAALLVGQHIAAGIGGP